MGTKNNVWVWVFVIFCSSFAFQEKQKLPELKRDILDEKEIEEIIEKELLHFDKFNRNRNDNGGHVYSRVNRQ